MALQSGHGGYVKAATLVIPVATWQANWRVRDAEATQSDSGGCSLYLPVVQDNSWEFHVGRDDTLFPEAVGLTIGAVISTMYFKLGAGTKGDKLTTTLITEVSPVVDNLGDLVRVTVRGKGGYVTPNQVIA